MSLPFSSSIQFLHVPSPAVLFIGVVCITAILFWSYFFARRGSTRRWERILLPLLRFASIIIVVICLFDPQRVEQIRHKQSGRLAVLLDTSRSMGINDVPAARLSSARDWLNNDILPRLSPDTSLSFHTFDQSLASKSDLAAATANGNGTGIADALDQLLAQPSQDPLVGVILCSDGIENAAGDAERVAATYKRRGIPIHTFLAGTTNEMKDIVVEGVEVKRSVTDQSPTRIEVTLRSPGYEHQTVTIQILQNSEVLASRQVTLTGLRQRATFAFTPRQKGYQVYDVVAPVQPGEWLADNNHCRFGLEIMDQTINVIYMEGTPGEAGYLKRALERDPYIKVKALYSPKPEFPTTLEALLNYDVVINSDIKRQYFTDEQLNATVKLVEDYGGGFVMIGGFSAFGSGGYQHTVIDRITPVAMEELRDYRFMSFRPRLTADAGKHPITTLSSDAQENNTAWLKLPNLYGYNRVDHAKPGAVVLAENPMENDRYGPMVVLAVQEVGKGRSMAFTSDTTRAWGEAFETIWGERINPGLPLNEANCDARYYRQFWINAIRWLAAGKVNQTNSPVTLELAKSQCVTNETVTATIRIHDKTGNVVNNAQVSLALKTADGKDIAFPPQYDDTARAYVSRIRIPKSGSYTATGSAMLNQQSLGEDRQLLDCSESDLEMADVRANPQLLARIASISHGIALSPGTNNISALLADLTKSQAASMEYKCTSLWNKPWLLALLIALLTAEWAIRRSRGFA